jgi:hypothetical protein
MPFKPNLSVKEGLDHLAKRLDPMIASRLADQLGGHPWTVVLEILNQEKGFASGYKHWTYDLQAQPRILTERLGDFGYPFDDKQRTVSTHGNELRIVRKQLAHMHGFSAEEASARTTSASGCWSTSVTPTGCVAPRDRPGHVDRVSSERQHGRSPVPPRQPHRDRQRSPLYQGQAGRHH